MYSDEPAVQVTRPGELIDVSPSDENKLEVVKADQFYGHEDVLIIGKVVSGQIKVGMSTECFGKKVKVIAIESKYGKIARTGLTIGITLLPGNKQAFKPKDLILFK